MITRAHTRRARAGFTLLEVVLAMFLLFLGATGILGMLSFSAGTARAADLKRRAADALPAIVAELEESLFPLVVVDGEDVAGDPPAERAGIPVPGDPELTYSFRVTPDPEAIPGDALPAEVRVDLEVSWRAGGESRSVRATTLLLREVPFGERLRLRFVEGIEPEPAPPAAVPAQSVR